MGSDGHARSTCKLPPFEADRLGIILGDFSLVNTTLNLAPKLVGPLMREGEVDELERIARRRVIIHSTFLNARRFEVFMDPIRSACENGVTFDLLWGAEKDEATEERSAKAAPAIARVVRDDPITRGRFRVHMLSAGSHAKFLFVDTEHGWLAAVGSCNWLYSGFQSVELSVILRDPAVLADLATALQRLVGRRGFADDIATEMALIARDLRRTSSAGGPAGLGIVVGEAHNQMNRAASGAATKRFFVGCHKLGSTARPGALMQGKVAAARPGVTATILYTQPSGPLKNRHARALRDEAAVHGVNLIKTRKRTLHGKIVAWGDDEKHEPVSDIDAVAVDGLKALDPKRPTRERTSPEL